MGLAALLVALAIGAFRLAIDLLPGYQERIVARIHETTGLTLEFDFHIRANRPLRAEIVFRGARVLPASGDEPLVAAATGPREPFDSPLDLVPPAREIARVTFVQPRTQFRDHAGRTHPPGGPVGTATA
jgi:hypothetical protein